MGLIVLIIVIGVSFLFIRFTTAKESTAKLIMRFGGIQKVFMQWLGHELDRDGNIQEVPGPIEKGLFGGLRIWIGLPVDKVHRYRLRWHSVEEREGKRVPVFHDEIKNSVMVKVDAYWMKTPGVETKDGQFPDVEWLVRMRAINPRKVISKAAHDWVESALTVLEPLLIWYVRQYSLQEFLDLTVEQIWGSTTTAEGKQIEGMGSKDIIQKVLKEEWGILIEENGIEKFAITPPKPYQEALAARSKSAMEAEATIVKAEKEAKARAAETVGTVIEMMASSRGKEVKDIRAEIDSDSGMKKDFLILTKDLIVRKMGLEGKGYLDIRVEGAQGIERLILNALAAWQRMPLGRSEEREKKAGEDKKDKLRGIIDRAKER